MDKLFFDTNILLDVIMAREPHYESSLEVLNLAKTKEAQGVMCALSLSNMAFILRKHDEEMLLRAIEHLRSFLEVSPLGAHEVDKAIARGLGDFEDGLQYESALAWGATHFLTRNVSDFPKTRKLPVFSPSDYLKKRK